MRLVARRENRPLAGTFSFPRARRLAGRNAFSRVFGGRHSAGNKHLVVYAMPNDLPYARLGLTVGRRQGNAVRRNRLKRLLREAFRLRAQKLPAGYDLVCVPRVGVDLTLDAACRSLVSTAQRAAERAGASKPSE